MVHWRRYRLLLLIASAVVYGRTPASAGALPFAPFVGLDSTAPVVAVTVNGRGPFRFLVDTGSSHTAIDAAAAATLGAPRVARTILSTSAGDEWTAVVRLDHLRLGPLDVSGVLATELPRGRLATAAVDGIVGQDLLGTRAFTIDYVARRLEWPDQPVEADAALPLAMEGPIWLVTSRGANGPVALVPDSGTDAVVLFDRGQWPGLRFRTGTIALQSVTNERPARLGAIPRLALERLQLIDQAVVVVDGALVDRAHGDGLLPLHLFARVTFEPGAGVVKLGRLAQVAQ